MKFDRLALENLPSWSMINGIETSGIRLEPHIIRDGVDCGGGLVSNTATKEDTVLVSVPQDLILNREQVFLQAKTDAHLRQLLETLGDFVESPRKAILAFLLMQITIAGSPEGTAVGVRNAFTDYVRSLPVMYDLPTFWTEEEREALVGTSLSGLLQQKLDSLQHEFDEVFDRTQDIHWCREHWWKEGNDALHLQDWIVLDAMYRSRALDLPKGVGNAMVPYVDMANHLPDAKCNARFEIDPDLQAMLVVRNGCTVTVDDEITINYGPGGACESVFSYGFLEGQTQSAREVFLTYTIPEDDPLRLAKMHYSKAAPGVRLYTDPEGQSRWDSELIWWSCINEEDGLDFDVAQTVDGGKELQALWRGTPLPPGKIKSLLQQDTLADIFRLRTIVALQGRVEQQGRELVATQQRVEQISAERESRKHIWTMIRRLRAMELELISDTYSMLEDEKRRLLMESRTVAEYLAAQREDGPPTTDERYDQTEEDDFS